MPNLNYLPAELVNLIVDHLQGQTVFACIAPTPVCASNESTTRINLDGTLEREGASSLPDAFSMEGEVISTARSAGAIEMLTGGPNIYFTLPHHYRNCVGVANGQWADASLNHPNHPGACVFTNASIFGHNTTAGSNSTLTAEGMCHYLRPNSAFCLKHQVYHNISQPSPLALPEWRVLSSYYNSLRALCLTSRRLNDLCMPRLYHALVEEDHTLSGGVQGRRLLLLLRTLIRNPGRGALIKSVTASTWRSLDTDCLAEDDMKAAFNQTEKLTSMYPWQVDIPYDPSDQKPVCLWQENPDGLPCNVQCPSGELLQSHVDTEHMAHLDGNLCRWSGCSRPLGAGRFFWKSQLKAHLCAHIGSMVAACPLCRQEFTSLQAVNVHLRDHHTSDQYPWEEVEVGDDVPPFGMSDQIEDEPPSRPESARSLQDWVTHDLSHPLSDFPFCSALAWSHEIRRGEWDPIFSFFLSYLPNLESITIQDPDAGTRCPFSQCYYLTTFMRRAALSQLRRSQSIGIRGISSLLRKISKTHGLADGSRQPQPQPVVSRTRKWSFPHELQLSNNKRHRSDRCTIEAIPCRVPDSTEFNDKTSAASEGAFVSSSNTRDKDVMERAQISSRPACEPLLPHLRSVTLDCMYRSADVHFADVLPFVSPPSVETLSCSYLVDDRGTALKAARLDLKTIAIKNGQLTAASVADLINACPLLKSFSFEVGGACEIAYQTLASADVKSALDGVAGTLEHLDLMKSDMNYWRPDYDVARLEGHTGFTFDSFRNFMKLRRLYLKAETMVRHSKDDPEADTGPLWQKLPASLEELHLAGNEKYFANILPEIQELLPHRFEALPRLQRVVMSWREDRDESESPQNWAETLVISFGKEDSIDENQRIVANFLAKILKNLEPKSDGSDDNELPPHNLPAWTNP